MDFLTIITAALIEHGGVWGVMVAALFAWNIYREKNTTEDVEHKKDSREFYIKRERELRIKIENLQGTVILLQEEKRQLLNNALELEEKVLKSEKDRIEDLKELLSDYYSMASDTLQALRKLEFFITNSGGKYHE